MDIGRKYLLLLLGLSLVFGQSDVTKLDQLKELQGDADYITLTPETLKKFVQNQSRNYIIVVYFSTLLYESQCSGCQVINPLFKKLSYSYSASNAKEPLQYEEEKLKPVFFAVLEYTQNTSPLFQKFRFRNIPNIYVSTKPYSEENNFFNIDRSKLFEYQDGKQYTAESLLSFLNSKTGRKVEIQTKLTEYLQLYGFYPSILLVSFLFLFITFKYYKNPKLWWLGSLLIYTICVGGAIYNILHEVQYGHYNPETGSLTWIASGSREQYFLEGFAMAGLFMLTGSSLVCVNLAANIEGRWLIRLASLTSVLIFAVCIYYPTMVYQQKASWYSPTFSPPGHYIKGSLLHDQGNSF